MVFSFKGCKCKTKNSKDGVMSRKMSSKIEKRGSIARTDYQPALKKEKIMLNVLVAGF